MKRIGILVLAAMFMASGCSEKHGAQYIVPTPAFVKGADVSWLSEMESGNKTFQKKDGTKADCFEVLKDCGVNAIRLRVWVNPTGGWSGKKDVVALSVRAAKAGMALMIDFHYSDFFCDPSRQDIPKAWASDKGNIDKMCAHVREHTLDVLNALKAEGVTPAWIQIGNETRNGMLWPTGQLWGTGAGGWDSFAKLYKSGYNAAKEVFPSALVMPHLNNAYEDNDWWFKELKKRASFDMIALSHYPQAETEMSPSEYNSSAAGRIKTLSATYGVPVMVSEVGVKTPANETYAAQVLSEFMTAIKDIPGCAGAFYWEPEVYDKWKPAIYTSRGWTAYDMGAFLGGGRPSKVMDSLTQ